MPAVAVLAVASGATPLRPYSEEQRFRSLRVAVRGQNVIPVDGGYARPAEFELAPTTDIVRPCWFGAPRGRCDRDGRLRA